MSGAHWLSFHIHYCSDPTELLCACVRPVLQTLDDEGLVRQYFFLRYGESGPHIRLRLKVSRASSDVVHQRISSAVGEWLACHPAAAQRNDWLNNVIFLQAYEPEIERFGGPVGLPVAERLFCRSSRLVLDLLSQTGAAPGLRVGAAAEAMAAALAALCCDASVIRIFLRRYVASGMALIAEQVPRNTQSGERAAGAVALWRRFLGPEDGRLGKRNSWSAAWAAEFCGGMLALHESGVVAATVPVGTQGIDSTLFRIVAGHLHLTNNRLGLGVAEETRLAAMLEDALPLMLNTNIDNGSEQTDG